MLEGLPDDEVDRYLEEHPRIVPLFEVDITAAVEPYITTPGPDEPDQAAIRELCQERNDDIRESEGIPVGGGGPRYDGQAKTGQRSKGVAGRG